MKAEAEAGELLLELRAEEMPPRQVPALARRLGTRLFEVLMGAGLAPSEVVSGFSRRRIVFWCRGLPTAERARDVRELGPPASEAWDAEGSPTAALTAFAARLGVKEEEITEVRTERGAYAGVVRQDPGRTTAELLAEQLPALLSEPANERAMFWGDGRGPWLRPLRGIIALFEGDVVPFRVFGIDSGAESAGHPVLSPERFTVASAAEYFVRLADRGIVVRVEERRARLAAELENCAKANGGVVDDVAGVVARMALDCEIPGIATGRIAPEHMALPVEILCAALAERPGAVVLRDAAGALLPRFITVVDRADDPEGAVAAGFERAVAGRLSDAVFLRAADRSRGLAEHAARLADLPSPFEGSWAEHGSRAGAFAGRLLELQDRAVMAPAAEIAASLMYADRVTALVAELALPAGMVGGLYAREEGHDEVVWQAIYDHRLPLGADGSLPRGEVGKSVALADRLMRLCAALGRGLEGTPDRATRQSADAAVRILVEGQMDFDVDILVGRAVRLGPALDEDGALTVRVADFLRERTRRLLGRRGFAFDEIAAASVTGGRLVDILARAEALRARRALPSFRRLVRAARRIERMVADTVIEVEEASASIEGDEAEQRLDSDIKAVRFSADQALGTGSFDQALDALEPLGPAIDHFFETVLVMADDPRRRARRLALLATARRLILRVARLTELRLAEAGGGETA